MDTFKVANDFALEERLDFMFSNHTNCILSIILHYGISFMFQPKPLNSYLGLEIYEPPNDF